ncbi:MAG: sulfite exporter TauE/SafE family protein [Thermoanaerobaculales bacterium]
MELWFLPLLTLVGVAVGFINVMAAGGSLISMPVLILLGLDPATANGTNRIAILVQNITAVNRFRSKGFSEPRLSLSLSLSTIPGAIAGAVAAIAIDPVVFNRILGLVLVLAVFLILGNERPPKQDREGKERAIQAHLAMVGVGFYGGFLQGGVGFLIMPILYRLLRLDLVRVNMHKAFIIGAYTIPALLVFAAQGKVWWLGGFALAAGNAAGAWVGTHVTITGGERAVRIVFVIAVIVMGGRLIFAG